MRRNLRVGVHRKAVHLPSYILRISSEVAQILLKMYLPFPPMLLHGRVLSKVQSKASTMAPLLIGKNSNI